MAVHRRPPVEGPPFELLVFRGDDWVSGDGVPPLGRWHYALNRPGFGGDIDPTERWSHVSTDEASARGS